MINTFITSDTFDTFASKLNETYSIQSNDKLMEHTESINYIIGSSLMISIYGEYTKYKIIDILDIVSLVRVGNNIQNRRLIILEKI